MFFQIAAARTCQLAEDRPYLGRWLRPGKDFIRFSRAGFLETLEEVLNNPTLQEQVAESARRAVEREHGFLHRVQKIIEVAGL